jgi:hypothetical protein
MVGLLLRCRCPRCAGWFASPGEVYAHAKLSHPIDVMRYLGSTLFDRDPLAVEYVKPALVDHAKDEGEGNQCADGTCPCWEQRAKRD